MEEGDEEEAPYDISPVFVSALSCVVGQAPFFQTLSKPRLRPLKDRQLLCATFRSPCWQ
jgi:hypothetical protein